MELGLDKFIAKGSTSVPGTTGLSQKRGFHTDIGL